MTVRLQKGHYIPGTTDTSDLNGHNGVPPGFVKGTGQHRGHILGAKLGGTNHKDLSPTKNSPEDFYNFVPMHGPVNTPYMQGVEMDINKAVQDKGKTVDYSVEFDYPDSTNPVPSTITLKADSATPRPATENPPFVINHPWPNDSTIRNHPKHDKISLKW
jgi:hypothetical protein